MVSSGFLTLIPAYIDEMAEVTSQFPEELNQKLLKMAIEIVDLPHLKNNGWIFHT